MSSHKRIWMIYADDDPTFTDESWMNADQFINGCQFRGDLKEAVAFAKRAAVSCHHPFVVVGVQLGDGRKYDDYCYEVKQ